MNEYEIAFIIGLFIGFLLILAYLFSWGCQWAWSWVDDNEIGEDNWIASKFTSKFPSRKWKYSAIKVVPPGGCEYIYAWEFLAFSAVIFAFICLPTVLLLTFKFYPVAIAAITLVLIAHISRFARRNKKMFDEHIKDKAAHQ